MIISRGLFYLQFVPLGYTNNISIMKNSNRGFTLIEILVVMGMLALLATVVLVAINPLRQFAQARNTQREANVTAILDAVGHRLADNRGIFEDAIGDCSSTLPGTATQIDDTTGYDLRPCLVPTYNAELPYDPSEGSKTCVSASCNGAREGYDTAYTLLQNASTSRITVCAPFHQDSDLSGSLPFCLTR